MSLITDIAKNAAAAAKTLALLDTSTKNSVLTAMAKALRANIDPILQANEKDLAQAKIAQLSEAMVDRLTLNVERINAMSSGIETLVDLFYPV